MTEEQFQEQFKAYLGLIAQLLTCSSGEEQAILHANSQLLDAAFVKTMELVAAEMAEDGEDNAEWLQGLANELAEMMEAKEK
ncbi:MAG: hypothetical protein O4807_16995, partial [Trichodesmium sp. St19_bin2]|nr:hypothetical protein [Trichodesmium sp. St19_bin2]